MRTGCLYILRSPSGKGYVGITTKTAEERFRVHCREARAGGGHALGAALRKYGPVAFTVRTLVVSHWDYLNDLEPKAIQAYGARFPAGYNLASGGRAAIPHPDSVAKQAAQMVGNTYAAGHRVSDELRDQLRRQRTGGPGTTTGTVLSPERRSKLSEGLRQWWRRKKERK